jgi:hypothetical protein
MSNKRQPQQAERKNEQHLLVFAAGRDERPVAARVDEEGTVRLRVALVAHERCHQLPRTRNGFSESKAIHWHADLEIGSGNVVHTQLDLVCAPHTAQQHAIVNQQQRGHQMDMTRTHR